MMSWQGTEERRDLLADALRRLREMRVRLDSADRAWREPIAVLGAGVRMPGDIDGLDAYWHLLCAGVDTVAQHVCSVDGTRPAKPGPDDGRRWASLLSEIDGFDAEFFGITANEANRMDPQQRLILEVAWEAIEDAGVPVERLRDRTTGVFLGLYGNDYLMLQLSDPAAANVYTASGSAHSIAANRLSYLWDLRGPSLAIDTACSSSLAAVHLACRALRSGDCDFALVGGVNVILSPLSTLATERVLPLAPSGRCRTFDIAADGIVRAEGCGVILLERLTDAQAASRPVRGVIRGTAVNHDGRTNGLAAPNPRAQVDLLRRALADSAADPADVVYVEAHGTGTPLGDPIEVEALREVYGPGVVACLLGSVKTNVGHQEAAAGIAGLLKAMLVLQHGQVPPNLHLDRLNPEISLARSRLRVPAKLTSLPDHDRQLAAVSSFGFGGANAHAILAGPPVPPKPSGHGPRKILLPVSARSRAALGDLAQRYADELDVRGPDEVADICAAAARQRSHHPHRLCVSAADPDELIQRLRTAAPRPVPVGAPPRVAFIFTGQGSQWAGMGAELLTSEPVVRDEVARCDAVIRDLTGWSVGAQLASGGSVGQSRLHVTEVAQLAIGTLQLGIAALWRSWGVEPDAVVGHSMGEIVAACAVGMLDRSQAFELLLTRARLTEPAARGGIMSNIELPTEDVERLVARVGGQVAVAATNAPCATVVSGEGSAVASVEQAAVANRAKTRRLPVEYGFHSPLLDDAAAELAVATGYIAPHEGESPLYSTVTGARVTARELDGAHWGRNLRDRVQFHPAIKDMARDGVSIYIEVGPHPRLLHYVGATIEAMDLRYLAVGSLRRDYPAATSLHRSLADLYCAGVDVRWEAVTVPPRDRVSLPSYPWQRRRHWLTVEAKAPALDPRPTARVEDLVRYVRERVAEALELESAEHVPPDRRLETLGMSSLTVVELRNQVERELGVTVPLHVLLEGGTPTELARSIEATLASDVSQ